ncbi:MAG: bacillolysin [Candidatus Limnocylindria bacterium]
MPRRSASRLALALLVSLIAAIAPAAASARQPAGSGSEAEALVFFPNPVVSSGNTFLTDKKDADYAALNDERVSVTLTNLDGSGYLRGDWAYVIGETGDPAFETDGTYDYTRHDDRFEQVMAYYWVTRSQLYLQSLGFGVIPDWPGINDDQQRVRINQWGVDNSFATTHPRDEMRFGKGGVDDAEDAEVILHELGHQIHFSQSETFFSSTEAGAISEGFGDYWAASVVEVALADAGLAPSSDPACIMDWDATSYTAGPIHCLRRLDANLMYPDDLNGRIHHDGTIWSQALWQIRGSLGNVCADQSILWAQFGWTGTTMVDLARRIVDAADDMCDAADVVQNAFADRGILPHT